MSSLNINQRRSRLRESPQARQVGRPLGALAIGVDKRRGSGYF
jgi:hypothetical protein